MSPAVVVDVGNTRVKWGLCAPDRVTQMASLPHDDEAAWQQQLSTWSARSGRGPWVISGVHPGQRSKVQAWLQAQGQGTIVLDSCRQVPLRLDVDFPERLGLDRLLNAVAVNAVRTPGAGAIVIDAGTAVTVDYVDAAGIFRGGAIFPGLRLMAKALYEHTALLPHIETFDPDPVPAKNTEDALRIGVFHAVLGGIESLAGRLIVTNPGVVQLYLGGGDAELLAPHLSHSARLWPEMTLEGIRHTAESSRSLGKFGES